LTSARYPTVGELVHVRSRRWLVEEIVTSPNNSDTPLIRLACADDDAQGQALDVYWDYELDGRILKEEGWADLASKGFDPPQHFGAFLHTLRWNCVTATDPNLFQSPFRAGIKIDAYQMEPLRKALRLPRVNLFIADDTGLGKTIEAGLIARELLLRKKVKTIVVAVPPSVLEQWKGEFEERFGLVFEIIDRRYLAKVRKERGFGVNPWRTHSRFLISHNLLIDPTYTDPMFEWLGSMLSGSLLILDEAHHAAPSSGGRYGIETKFTRAVRDVCGRFEHRLFLSATPHNGHSNSFSTLLELLDPYRFTRGVKVRKTALDEIMVRRLKEDVRAIQGGFPVRKVERIVIDGLPDSAPELQLSILLDQYRSLREQRLLKSSSRARAASGLLVIGLQQRLLSSTEAFARSLKVHRGTVERQWNKSTETKQTDTALQELPLLTGTPDADDIAGTWTEEELESQEAVEIETAAAQAERATPRDTEALRIWESEQDLLDKMQHIAEENRFRPDAKVLALLDWIRQNLCPGLPPFGMVPQGEPPQWNNRRMLIFTENREGTKRYINDMLGQAIEGTEGAADRIQVIDGLTSTTRRKEIQKLFNTDPAREPLRILLATDAAREGLNFQAHCTDLFHIDLPWNPGRIEQRNGRIDRKLQPADEVRCHYFVLPQRAEDRVLEVLVRKTETIKRELGSLSKVIDDDIERRLTKSGIRHDDAENLARSLESAELDDEKRRVTEEELEATRDRQEALKGQIERCQTLLDRSRSWVAFEPDAFREALSCSLEMLGADPLAESVDDDGRHIWTFPPLDRRAETDSSWASTLDTLRVPRKTDEKLTEWRRESPIRPVIFEDAGVLTDDTVHLHLDQRVVQRLLARFKAQGYVYNDLSRACLTQVADSIPRVVLLGRLSLYGQGAERLHEEIVTVASRWLDPDRRTGPLRAYAEEAESRTLDLLEQSLSLQTQVSLTEEVRTRLLESSARDIGELLPQLEPRAEDLSKRAQQTLQTRGEREARELRATLEQQRDRVLTHLTRNEKEFRQLTLGFEDEERRQLESNMQFWKIRLEQFNGDLKTEPDRVRDFYKVRTTRVEPIGLMYLWPESN
jgi:ERCC4-related helicase